MNRTRALGGVFVALVLVTGLALNGATAAVPPSVATTSIAGFPVENGRVSPLVRTSTVAVNGTANAAQPLVADAGDSKFVRSGDSLTVDGFVTGGMAPYEVDWTFNGASDRFGTPEAARSTFSTTGLANGNIVLTFSATDSLGRTASDTVKVRVWTPVHRLLLDKSVATGPGVPDEDPTGLLGDTSGVVDQQTDFHPFTVPSNTLELNLTLNWKSYVAIGIDDPTADDDSTLATANKNDYDLYVDDPSDREDENISGATAAHPENMSLENPAPGAWRAKVAAFLVDQDTYRLRVKTAERPANPLPTVSTPGPFQFAPDQRQRLTATASGGTAPLKTAWDTNLDGIFESPGTTVDTVFDVGTHLVAVKTVDAAGYEAREVVGVRVGVSEGPTAPLVVIGLADTGINVYHEEFGAELYPDARVRELTDDFTRHPSEYIDGFPESTPSIDVTHGAGYFPPADHGLFDRDSVPLNQLFWVPGTKIIGVRDGGDADDHDIIPILDDHYVPATLEVGPGHGTGSASVAAGNVFGFCPTCLVVFSEDINGDTGWLYDQPWIDIVSASYSPQSNIGSAGLINFGIEGMPKEAAERGQLGLFAAGNGNENGFITPEQTYTSDLAGPSWAIRVGAAERSSRKPIVGTGKPVDVTSWGAGNIPAANHNGTSVDADVQQHGGTSAATPYTSGVFGTVLGAVRAALGDGDAGQRGNGVVARGTPIAGNAYLSDGEFTSAELREVVFKTTQHDAGSNVALLPTTTPNNPAQFVVEGYGIAEPASAQRAIDVLLGGAALPDRLPEDVFFTADHGLRDVLWGGWSGGGENSSEASAAAAASARGNVDLGALGGVTKSAITDTAAALELLDRAILTPHPTAAAAADTQAAATGPTYFLHHLGGCVDGADPGAFMDLANSAGDDDFCGSAGTAGLFGAEVEAFTATAPVGQSLAVGSSVDGIIHIATDAPAPLTMTATLLAGGAEVGSGSSDVQTLGVGDFLFGNGFVPVPMSFDLTKAVTPGQTLTLSIALEGTASQYFGYEDDHASSFTITPAGGGGGGGGSLAATITSPAEGAEFDPAATPTLAVAGTATFPDSAGPTARWYPKWTTDAAGNCASQFLTQDPNVVSSSCSQTLQALAPTGVAEFRETYPMPASALPARLSAAAPVTGTLYYGSTPGSPVHRVRVELVTLQAGQPVVLGSQVVEGVVTPTTQGLTPRTPFPFSFSIPAQFSGVALSSLSLDAIWEQSTLGFMERNNPDSFVDLPMSAGAGSGSVEVSLDSPTFASPIEATLGTDGTWGAPIPLGDVADGTHTVYARAVQGTSVSPVVSRTFVVKRAVVLGDRVQVQLTLRGVPPVAGAWQNATDTSASGNLSTWAAQVTAAPKATYELHSRLILGGKVAARGAPVVFVRSAQK